MKLKLYLFAIHRDGEVGVEVHTSHEAHYNAVREHCLEYYQDRVACCDNDVELLDRTHDVLREAETADLHELIGMYEDSTDSSIHRTETTIEIPILTECQLSLSNLVGLHHDSVFICGEDDQEMVDRCVNAATETLVKLNSLK